MAAVIAWGALQTDQPEWAGMALKIYLGARVVHSIVFLLDAHPWRTLAYLPTFAVGTALSCYILFK